MWCSTNSDRYRRKCRLKKHNNVRLLVVEGQKEKQCLKETTFKGNPLISVLINAKRLESKVKVGYQGLTLSNYLYHIKVPAISFFMDELIQIKEQIAFSTIKLKINNIFLSTLKLTDSRFEKFEFLSLLSVSTVQISDESRTPKFNGALSVHTLLIPSDICTLLLKSVSAAMLSSSER